MIEYKKFTLKNGLRVIVHEDHTTPLVVVNTLYDVGARDENPDRTGFAHLFEHLMFGGSVNIPNFDGPLQKAGGTNNAFTSNDITNYYDVLPAQNLETAIWLESDRMLSLAFTDKSLEVQRNVVIEEFKQRYLNQPYGDLWLELRPLAFKVHPYQWATIGKNIQHIEEATMEEVKDFFHTHYHPGNAILCIAGNVKLKEVRELVEKWYGTIPAQQKKVRNLPKEPLQTEFRSKIIERKVPTDLYTYAFKMGSKLDVGYYEADLLSDVLGGGKTSRLYKKLKKELELVSSVNAYISGSIDAGLLTISAQPSEEVKFEEIDAIIWQEIQKIQEKGIPEEEFIRVLNKFKTAMAFHEQGILNKAMNLCYYENLGDIELINSNIKQYESLTPEKIQDASRKILQKENCSLLTIKAQKNG